jgi:tetratricopeptide (TPR) repeat protein
MKKAQQLDNTYTMSRYWIARSWMNLLEFPKAIEAFEELLTLTPDWTTVRMRLGETFEKCGQIEKAQQCYERVFKDTPTCAIACYTLSKIYIRLGQTMKAIQCLQAGLRENPESSTLKKELEFLTSVDMP